MWSWIGYMNPHRLSYGFAYNFPFAAIIGAVTLVSLIFYKGDKKFVWTPISTVLVLFIIWTCITTIFALDPEAARTGLIKFLKIQVVVLITFMLFKTKEQIIQLVWVIVISIGFYGVKGGIFTIKSGGAERVWGPPDSEIGGNNEVALAIIMIIPLMSFLYTQLRSRYAKLTMLMCILLSIIAAIGSQSRGALLAASAMGLVLWIKSSKKFVSGIAIALVAIGIVSFMPQSWHDRMNTIEDYEEDASAMGRINAWYVSIGVALDRPLTAGGFRMISQEVFDKYAPDPEDVHDVHSIYFEVLGEHGFIGLALFLSLMFMSLASSQRSIRYAKQHEDLAWARSLLAMIQVSILGYLVGGAFLGLAYYDLVYHYLTIVVLTGYIIRKNGQQHDGNASTW